MPFEEKFEQYMTRMGRFTDQLSDMTEEATKNALVMPFFSMLGYDVFDTNEFMPEYTCDVATKKGEKIDYAILRDGEPVMLIECKRSGMKLQKQQQAQLFRYFSTNRCRIAILTNGITYQFFSDLNAPNVMDEDPFLSFNLQEDDPSIIRAAIRPFQREKFDVKNVISKAVMQKYSKVVEKAMLEELECPSDALVKLFLSRPEVVTGSRITSQMIEKYREVTRLALQKVFRIASQPEEQPEPEQTPAPRRSSRSVPRAAAPAETEAPVETVDPAEPVQEEAAPPEPAVEEPAEVISSPTPQSITESITQSLDSFAPGGSCKQEDTPDFIRLHIYTAAGQKLAVLKIAKADLSLQLRKFTNGIPASYEVKDAEECIRVLRG